MNTLSCHGLLVSSPHPAKPWTSKVTAASTHTNTDPANAVTCAICHTGGANSSLVPPAPAIGIAGCYNNTLCHFHALPFAPPAVAPSVHGGLAKQNLTVCQSCHGIKGSTSFDGLAVGNGAKTIACSSCHTFAKAHPTVWQGSSANPGETVIYSHRTAGSIADSCALCHDVTKGRTAPLPAAPSCFSATFTNPLTLTAGACHANGPGAAAHIVPYPNHGAAAGSNVNYCLGCHQVAANAAGSKPPGCQNCHLSSPVVTPTGCTSCHAKPPAGLSYPDLAGLHASHAAFNVTQNANLTAVCDQCHSGLGLGTLDHLNRARSRTASVQANPAVFGSLATTGGLSPVYSGATRTCANTYCHGSSLAGFSLDASVIRVPSWSTPFPAGTHCDKCHGYPPATASHASLPGPAQCINCHSHVNASGTGFTDPAKHINGVVEAAGGHSFPNPGSVHRVAANGVGCLSAGCHVLGSAVSLYPVSSGTPPDCRGCHLGANPGTDPQCSDCHGSVTNNGAGSLLAGRPVGGAAFPNRPGQHNRSEHVGRACTFCHPLTSGNSSHGWSNRLKSNAAKVGGAGTSITSWNAVTKSCSPTCHGSQIW
jgi:predicted CxxxxCH...CXXCH cytochrome family protein